MTWLEEVRALQQRSDERQQRAEQRMQRVDDRLERVEGEIATLTSAVQSSHAQLIERVHKLEVTLVAQIGNVKADLMKWSFVFWVGAVAAIAMLAGVVP